MNLLVSLSSFVLSCVQAASTSCTETAVTDICVYIVYLSISV